jgi:hypothetical protein
MMEKSYADRDVLDKLGIRAGMRVRTEGPVPPELVERIRAVEDVEIVTPDGGEPVHVAVLRLSALSEAKPILARLRKAIVPAGAIWVLTGKKGASDYVRQESLIPLGKAVGLVDNKSASIDEATSGIRFVIPLAQREKPKPNFG